MTQSVSIVIPTKNNGDTLSRTLQSLNDLIFPHDDLEVIVVDGYSTDDTVTIAKEYNCVVIFENRGTIAYARDLGLKAAQGEFVAFTDADCVVEKSWLQELLIHFNDNNIAAVGGPNITPADDSQFAKCVGNVLSFLSSFGARYGLSGGKVRDIHHNPTCNVIYRKKILEEVRGFNHILVTADDEEIDYRVRERGYRLIYTPSAVVYHYRRPTWRKYIKMAHNYGMGRAQVIRLHKHMARWFHLVPSTIVLVIFLFLILSSVSQTFLWTALIVLAMGGLGIAAISFFLDRHVKNFLITCGLIAIWFWGWAIGFFNGAFTPMKHNKASI